METFELFLRKKQECDCIHTGELVYFTYYHAEVFALPFLDENFLLRTETARRLYRDYAAELPIIDYHCHIDPKEIWEDRRFENITQVWLGGDHYKWRILRSEGVPEAEITGDADDHTKFLRFAAVMPKLIGNPMYHWCHLELKRYFGFDKPLSAETAEEAWTLCNGKLQALTVRKIIAASNVHMIGTTDDPADDLCWHAKIAADPTVKTIVAPSFRPDKAVNPDKPGFADYICRLGKAAGMELHSAADVKRALAARLDFFCTLGCRATDHGLDRMVYAPATENEVEQVFAAAMAGETLTVEQADKYRTSLLLFLGREYARRGLVMQLHFNVQRNTNAGKFALLGPDTGFDTMADHACGQALTGFLSALDTEGLLPKTILYSLNPKDNALIGSIIGAFQGEGICGKLQHGSGWWFNDTKPGMEEQMRTLATLGIFGNFIGMLTDSRSFLSYTRHEYFRRILCDLVGAWAENGEYPADFPTLGELVRNISYFNAKSYFEV